MAPTTIVICVARCPGALLASGAFACLSPFLAKAVAGHNATLAITFSGVGIAPVGGRRGKGCLTAPKKLLLEMVLYDEAQLLVALRLLVLSDALPVKGQDWLQIRALIKLAPKHRLHEIMVGDRVDVSAGSVSIIQELLNVVTWHLQLYPNDLIPVQQ